VPKAPVIVQTIPDDGVDFEADAGQDVILSCQVDAVPSADILWIKNRVCSLKLYNFRVSEVNIYMCVYKQCI